MWQGRQAVLQSCRVQFKVGRNMFSTANDGVIPPREVLQILQPTLRGSKFSKIEVAARANLQGSSREPSDLGRA